MFSPLLSRRKALVLTARLAASVAMLGLGPLTACVSARNKRRRDFNVLDHGAAGDGVTLDSDAVQRAIDAAAAFGAGARVVVPGGRRYLVGTIELKGEIEFHLADDAELFASTRPGDFGLSGAMMTAQDAQGLSLTGSGGINGRSAEFMTRYDEKEEWWIPAKFRPRLALFTACRDLVVRDVTFNDAPSWTLHLLGCDRVQVNAVKIKNQLSVPNSDGIDPDHCRNVEISNCHIVCGDDAIVVKTSRRDRDYGDSFNISVRDCVLETQDSGVKIGTETTRDIRGISFERCEIVSSSRGCTIQLRDEGNVSDVLFRDITFKSRYHSAPWWGRGEAISLTAFPRRSGTAVGKISAVRVERVTGQAENSVRVSGCAESRIRGVKFENVDITLSRWTHYPGGEWDNRPTTALPEIESHATPGIHVRYADEISLHRCRIQWGENCPDYFSHALEAHDVTGLAYPDFVGESAHPARIPAISVR